ncbi:MAG: DUF72 domain-containing protein [Sandaracinaceae bacterium]
MDLFQDPLPAPDPELVALAEAIPPHVRFGTSSWTFEGWRDLVYQKRYATKQAFVRESLREYAAHPLFDTVGVDRSYYAPLTREDWRAQAAQLPPGFRACSKVWGELTTRVFPRHDRYGERAGQPNPFFLDPPRFLESVLIPLIEGFDDHAGPLIVEIPPSPVATEPRAFAASIDRFLRGVPSEVPLAFELREPALLSDAYLSVLRRHPHASHVINLHTRMPTVREQMERGAIDAAGAGAPLVCRLMLPPGRRYAEMKEAYAPFDRIVEPQPEMRADVVALIEATRGVCELYVLVNNKVEGSSPLTVRGLVEELSASLSASTRTPPPSTR